MKWAFSIILVLFLPASVHAVDKIRIGFPGQTGRRGLLAIGDKRGFFQEEGLQGEFIRINPAIAFQALVAGEIDYYTVLGPGVAAAIRGVPVKLVAAYVPVAPTALIARPEIKSILEFKGKTIGVNAYGGALAAIGRLMLKPFTIQT